MEFLYDEDTGQLTIGRDGKPERRAVYGIGVCPPMCQTDKGCPKGTPENQKSLSEANKRCYRHYKECRAVGAFPDDPIVRRNAAIVREETDRFERSRELEFQQTLIRLVVSAR